MYICIEKNCNKKLSDYRSKRCRHCANLEERNPTYKFIPKKILFKEYVKKKKSARSIAKKLEVSTDVILKRLKKYNIKVRNKSESMINNKNSLGYKQTKRHITKHTFYKEKHPAWQGGISKLPYDFSFNDELKEQIRKRDDYKCQLCKIIEEEHIIIFGFKLSVHHIDYDKMNCKKDNLISLCISCHMRTNINRKYWRTYFENYRIRKTT